MNGLLYSLCASQIEKLLFVKSERARQVIQGQKILFSDLAVYAVDCNIVSSKAG